jgi:hypothetical protein
MAQKVYMIQARQKTIQIKVLIVVRTELQFGRVQLKAVLEMVSA